MNLNNTKNEVRQLKQLKKSTGGEIVIKGKVFKKVLSDEEAEWMKKDLETIHARELKNLPARMERLYGKWK